MCLSLRFNIQIRWRAKGADGFSYWKGRNIERNQISGAFDKRKTKRNETKIGRSRGKRRGRAGNLIDDHWP